MSTLVETKIGSHETCIWKATLFLGLAIMMTRVTNFFTQVVIAHQFGTGFEADAYFVVENIMLLLTDFIITGFSVAYIPIWMEYKVKKGELEAQRFDDAFVTTTAVATLFFAVIVFFAAPLLIRLAAPGFSDLTYQTAVNLLMTITPALAFLGLTAACTGILQANRRFVVPELSYMFYNLVVLLAAILFVAKFGLIGLTGGIIFGAFLRLLIQLLVARRVSPMRLSLQFKHEGVLIVLKRVFPIFFAYAGIQFTILAGNMVASVAAEGAVSRLIYASRVMLIPVGLLALPLQITIFPTLSHQVAQNQIKELGKTVIKGFCMLGFTTIPATAGLVLLRTPLVQLLYERGAFGPAATSATADMLGWYALGIPGIAGLMIVNSLYSSLGEPITLVLFNLINWVTTVGLSWVLIQKFGSTAIAFSISLSTIATCLFALWSSKRRLAELDMRFLGVSIYKSSVATGVMVIVLIGFQIFLTKGLITTSISISIQSLITILSVFFVGMVTYGVTAYSLKIVEMRTLVNNFSQWISQQGLIR